MKRIRAAVDGSEFAGRAFVFGGCVRDRLLGRPPRDIDLLVVLPDGGQRLARFLSRELAGTEVAIYGRKGVAQCVMDGVSVECRTGCDAGGTQACDIAAVLAAEARYIDFTVNALLEDLATGELHDPGGMALADLRTGAIRTPLSVDLSMSMDAKRLIRAVRLTAELGFTLDANVADYIIRHAADVLRAGVERVRDELVKLLDGPDPVQGIRLIDETGLDRKSVV